MGLDSSLILFLVLKPPLKYLPLLIPGNHIINLIFLFSSNFRYVYFGIQFFKIYIWWRITKKEEFE